MAILETKHKFLRLSTCRLGHFSLQNLIPSKTVKLNAPTENSLYLRSQCEALMSTLCGKVGLHLLAMWGREGTIHKIPQNTRFLALVLTTETWNFKYIREL